MAVAAGAAARDVDGAGESDAPRVKSRGSLRSSSRRSKAMTPTDGEEEAAKAMDEPAKPEDAPAADIPTPRKSRKSRSSKVSQGGEPGSEGEAGGGDGEAPVKKRSKSKRRPKPSSEDGAGEGGGGSGSSGSSKVSASEGDSAAQAEAAQEAPARSGKVTTCPTAHRCRCLCPSLLTDLLPPVCFHEGACCRRSRLA